jgi:hypothetical protein
MMSTTAVDAGGRVYQVFSPLIMLIAEVTSDFLRLSHERGRNPGCLSVMQSS